MESANPIVMLLASMSKLYQALQPRLVASSVVCRPVAVAVAMELGNRTTREAESNGPIKRNWPFEIRVPDADADSRPWLSLSKHQSNN